MRTDPKRNLWKGFLAGALGGLAASFAMSQFHALFQKAGSATLQGGDDSTVKAASAVSRTVFHHELTVDQKKFAGPVVHYTFGANVAAIYGITAEHAPRISTGWGIPFGAAVWLGAHVITVPAFGLSDPVTHSEPGAEALEFGAHLVYGAVAEGLRRFLRRRLLR